MKLNGKDKVSEGLEKALCLWTFSEVKLSKAEKSAYSSLVKEPSHHLKGWFKSEAESFTVIINVSNPDAYKTSEDDLRCTTYFWKDEALGALTLSIHKKQEEEGSKDMLGRACILQNDAKIKNMLNSKIYVVLTFEQKVFRKFQIEPATLQLAQSFSKSISLIGIEKFKYNDNDYAYWGLINSSNIWNKLLEKNDHLQISWFKHYRAEINIYEHLIPSIKKNLSNSSGTISKLSIESQKLLNLAADGNLEILILYADELNSKSMLIRECFESARIIKENELSKVFGLIVNLYINCPLICESGLSIGYTNGIKMKILSQKIETEKWSEDDAANYWANLHRSFRVDYHLYINADDRPQDFMVEAEGWKEVRLDADTVETEALIDSILEESVSNKKWIIPTAAHLSLKIGCYDYIKIFEIRDEIYFLFKDKDERYGLASVNPYKKNWALELKFEDENSNFSKNTEIAIKLLLASVIRDFWVIEDRKAVFNRKNLEVENNFHRNKKKNEASSTVYLPRIRYTSTPCLEKCSDQLEFSERRKHFVRAHLRKVQQASAVQMELAKIYGLKVSPGFTFVKPHERGDKEKITKYRSRSALQLLYGDDELSIESNFKGPDWFKFEKDIQRLLVQNSFEIIKVASIGVGDGGIDISATRANDGKIEKWAVQCKCYSKKTVGPKVIRELHGSMFEYGANRGMVVTTTSFTPGAIKTANMMGIKLIDGNKLTSLLDSKLKII